MEKLLYIISMGFAGAYIAKRRKLNPFFWFAVCSMLGLIGLLSFIFFPIFMKKKKKKTSPPLNIPPKPLFPLDTIWYYLDDKEEKIGPVSFARLLEDKKEGKVQEKNYIWNERFDEWKLWGNVFPAEKIEG